ncbi:MULTISPECIES: hypothetical protein [unclassified Nostoc]|nr:hypothetical protein [Nostoc sp. NMS7]
MAEGKHLLQLPFCFPVPETFAHLCEHFVGQSGKQGKLKQDLRKQ